MEFVVVRIDIGIQGGEIGRNGCRAAAESVFRNQEAAAGGDAFFAQAVQAFEFGSAHACFGGDG